MKKITSKQIMLMHERLIAETGGTPELRDRNLLESALNAPFQTFSGEELYPDILEKAARLGYGLIKNHPFADGNKRIGVHTMFVFLELNQVRLSYTDDEAISLVLDTAGGISDDAALLAWLKSHQTAL